MRRTVPLMSLIVMLTPCVAVAHVVRHTTIPEAYRGTWATEAASCAPDQGAIVLAAKTYVAPGAKCTVVYVDETAGANGPIFSARLSCSDGAGGGAKKSFLNFIIRPDKGGISAGPTFSSLVAYQRCLSDGAQTNR